jgi:hypothetical protein
MSFRAAAIASSTVAGGRRLNPNRPKIKSKMAAKKLKIESKTKSLRCVVVCVVCDLVLVDITERRFFFGGSLRRWRVVFDAAANVEDDDVRPDKGDQVAPRAAWCGFVSLLLRWLVIKLRCPFM